MGIAFPHCSNLCATEMCCSTNINSEGMFNAYYCEYRKIGFRNHDSYAQITLFLLIMIQLCKDKAFTA